MYDIQIPEPLFAEAQRAAAAGGLTVEAYVQEVLRMHFEEDAPVQLTAEQEAIIAKAEAAIDAGDFFTAEQMRGVFHREEIRIDAKQPRLTIIYAPATRAELNKIWKYNAKKYGKEHAADYIDFLQDGIEGLAADPEQGSPVENFPQLRALTLKRSPRGDGHIAVYRLDQAKQVIRVLHVYHTAQDIQGRLGRKRP